MTRIRIPAGDDWRNHAVECPNCKQPVLVEDEHFHPSDQVDPAWYGCDFQDT